MAKPKLKDKIIMVVDDDADLTFILTTQLQQAGYSVHTCPGGKNLFEDVLKHNPSLLLLDIAMQMIDGSELCHAIKKDPRTKQVKILLMSGNHNLAEHAAACGADGFIAKPLSLSDVKTAVSKYA